jgi:UDP-N-acetylmuramoyl-tripeptide--D-alanyl-D-alanine ligase
VAAVCGGRVVGNRASEASSVVADSRTVRPGMAFAAVRGGRGYVQDAVRAGAPWVLVDDAGGLPLGATAVVVEDTVTALGAIAADVRASLDVRVIGITGSTGKTLTKDFLSAVLGVRFRVHSAPSSYNNEIGLPLVVLGCPDDAEVMVTELGARRPGEVADLCAICRPHIGVLTGVGTTHLELFRTRAAIASTKSELLASLPPDGLGVVPADDDFLSLFAERTSARLATVGAGGAVSYRASGVDASGSTHGWVAAAGRGVPVTLPVPGRALMRNAAMALVVATEVGIDLLDAASALARAPTSSCRMEITRIGRWAVVNDAYNANPTSTASALRTVRELAADRPCWAVLGEMAELGPTAAAAHHRIGRLARALGYAGVVAVGERAAGIATGAAEVAHRVDTADEAAALIASRVPAGSWVLVKGSRVTALDRFPQVLRERLSRSLREV